MNGPAVALPRVFLSYGRRDAHALADLMATALSSHGYEVWRDTAQLRGGRSWEAQIVEALRKSDVVLALLSPHSTRSIADGGDDDSVCLDELAFARYERPSRPIVPVLAVPGATVPLTVLRLHQLDFTDVMQDSTRLDAKLPGLLEALQTAIAGQAASRNWEQWVRAPGDAGAFLHAKHRGFVGREWLFRDIERWRTQGSTSALLIRGDPGIGKSALIAELALGGHAGATLATYCCQWDAADSLRPEQFVRSLAHQCALRIPAYATRLQDESLRQFFERIDVDPASTFERAVLDPLSELQPPPGGPWLWCVDALDEAQVHRAGPTVVDVIASRLDRLPPWIRLLATTRNNGQVLRALGLARVTEIDAQTPDNLADLRRHIEQATSRLQTQAKSSRAPDAGFIEAVLTKSGGSFLYADFVLRARAAGGFAADRIPDLPPGLNGVFERELRRALPHADDLARLRPLLELLCAAVGPVPGRLLAQAAGLSDRGLAQCLKPIFPFLRRVDVEDAQGPADAAYVFWHKSIYDFLTGPDDADSPFAVEQQRGDTALAALIPTYVADGPAPRPSLPQYLRVNAMTHLAASGQFLGPLSDKALARLLDLLVVQGAGRPGVGALLNAWPTFVALAVRQTRWPELDRLLDAVIGQADRWFQEAGLWTERIESDGRRVRVLTGQATEAGPLAEALVWASLGVSVPDQVLALHGSGEPFEELLDKLAGVHHVVGGLDMAGWADGLSGYFEDQGYALNIMLNNLRQGKRARSWGNQ